jgi:hypothetical protein
LQKIEWYTITASLFDRYGSADVDGVWQQVQSKNSVFSFEQPSVYVISGTLLYCYNNIIIGVYVSRWAVWQFIRIGAEKQLDGCDGILMWKLYIYFIYEPFKDYFTTISIILTISTYSYLHIYSSIQIFIYLSVIIVMILGCDSPYIVDWHFIQCWIPRITMLALNESFITTIRCINAVIIHQFKFSCF